MCIIFTHLMVDTTERCCWQNQNVIRTFTQMFLFTQIYTNVLVYTKECKWIQWSVVVGKIRMLLGQGNAVVNQIKMNTALVICMTVWVGSKDIRLTCRLCLFGGRGSTSICCRIWNFLLSISKNLKCFGSARI